MARKTTKSSIKLKNDKVQKAAGEIKSPPDRSPRDTLCEGPGRGGIGLHAWRKTTKSKIR